jgi:preprotein translocase subunit SecD
MNVKVGRSQNLTLQITSSELPSWAKWVGLEVRHVQYLSPNGAIAIRFGKSTAEEDRFRVTGSELDNGNRLYHFQAKAVLDQIPETFGITDAQVTQTGDDFIDVEVPAVRNPLRIRNMKKAAVLKPKEAPSKSSALAKVKEHLGGLAKESPPPGFVPAIPLREAIDTINSYKVAEGDALELSISRRGRLKLRYEYGG